MTDNIKQDNRSKLSKTQNENIKLLAELLNEDSSRQDVLSDNADNKKTSDSDTPATSVYVTGNNNIVSTQKSTIIIKKQSLTRNLLWFACATLFF